MPRGRKPMGEKPLTGAERQARYRAKAQEDHRKALDRARRRARNPSRVAQWEEAVETLIGLQEEFQEWQENLPENLASSALAEKLDTICNLDLNSLRYVGALPETQAEATSENLREVCGIDLSELEYAEVPLGFGRD